MFHFEVLSHEVQLLGTKSLDSHLKSQLLLFYFEIIPLLASTLVSNNRI